MAKKESPDYSTRIQPGERRNPHGRPRKTQKIATGSAYDAVLNREIVVTLGGIKRELPMDEALGHRTLQAALKGERMATRTVLKWIKKREEARPSKQRNLPTIKMEFPSPATADEALLILGIATEVQDRKRNDGGPFVELQSWAVASALARPIRRGPSAGEIAEVKRCTRNADTVSWPGGHGE